MSSDEWIVIGVLVAMVAALVTRRVSPAVGVTGALLALYFADVLSTGQLLSGFSNPAPATIAALYVISGAIERSGALVPLTRRVLKTGAPQASLARLAGVSAGLSAVVANTPIVAMLIGPVERWARRGKEAPSKYLIPLSYAAVLGGMPTIIGTSTNVIASGIVASSTGEAFGFFEPAKLGLPVAILGLIMITLLSRRVLPARGEFSSDAIEQPFTVSMQVSEGGSIDGKTVAEAGLRQLGSVYVVAVQRSQEITSPVNPELVLRAGDQVTFAGQVDDVVELDRLPGLDLLEGDQVSALEDGQHAWFEAVVGATSPLVGKSIKGSDFRRRYQAAVIAIHRSGAGLDAPLGTARLHIGDSLLLVADQDFAARWRNRGDFLLVQRRREPPPTASRSAGRSLLILVGVAIAALAGVGVLKAALFGAAATVLTGALTPRQARDSVDVNVVVLIGAAIGVGVGVEASGLANRLGDLLVELTGGAGTWGVAVGVVLATLLLTELITNAGAVALMVPIAMRVADDVGAEPRLFALGITVAASASFLTPIGYQTNTMVYGPGRYRFTDYLRLGLPLTVMVVALVPVLMVI